MRSFFLFFSLLTTSTPLALGADHYRCSLIIDDGIDGQKVDDSQYVDLVLDPEPMPARIHINSASNDLVFNSCTKTIADGSNFASWFEYECRELQSLDGGPFSTDVFLAGAYAGISPPVTPDYPLYAPLVSVSEQLGLDAPLQTFVIYADRKPQYEFFCYAVNAAKS